MFNVRDVMYMTIFHIIFTSELVVEINLCYSGVFCWRRAAKTLAKLRLAKDRLIVNNPILMILNY